MSIHMINLAHSRRSIAAMVMPHDPNEQTARNNTTAAVRCYGWTGQQPSSGFCDLAPSILHYNWF
jgi:hypothetical protein